MLYFLPFFLMRDIYPFFRFSMFTTPVSQAAYVERYEWYVWQSRMEKWQLLAPEAIGLDEPLFYYRARSANITKQGSAFLAILMEVYRQKKKELPAASLLVEKRFKQGQYLDSLVVAQWTRP